MQTKQLVLAGALLATSALSAVAAVPVPKYGPNPNQPPQIAKPAANWQAMPGGTWASIATLPDWPGPWSYDNRMNFSGTHRTDTNHAEIHGDPSQSTRSKPRAAKISSREGLSLPSARSAADDDLGHRRGVRFRVPVRPHGHRPGKFAGPSRLHLHRTHPADAQVPFNGHSIGHWEANNTIMNIDTVAIRPDVQLFYGMPGGGKLHVGERMSQILPNKIQSSPRSKIRTS